MCDTLGATARFTATGSVLFGKNSDRDHLEAQLIEAIPRRCHPAGSDVQMTYVAIPQVEETFALLLSRPHWIWGAEIGSNEHGVTIGNEAVFSRRGASTAPGIIGMDYLRLALERAASGDEAVSVITQLLERYGQSGECGFRRSLGYDNAFLIADRDGIRIIETAGRDWALRRVVAFDAISNGYTIEADFEAASASLRSVSDLNGDAGKCFSFRGSTEDPDRRGSSDFRRSRMLELMSERERRLDVAHLFRILRDHKEGPGAPGKPGARICAHRRENPIGQTTAAWVSDLDPRKSLHWVTATSAPCTSVFKPLIVGAPVPAHGSIPGAEAEDASLWWRHEKLRAALDDAGPQAEAEFRAERDALEAAFLDAAVALPATHRNGEASQECRMFIERCWSQAWIFENDWHMRLHTGLDT